MDDFRGLSNVNDSVSLFFFSLPSVVLFRDLGFEGEERERDSGMSRCSYAGWRKQTRTLPGSLLRVAGFPLKPFKTFPVILGVLQAFSISRPAI